MAEFTIKFIGHIKERERSEGFPADVMAIGTYSVQDNRQIAEEINKELMAFIGIQGMIVQIDPAQTVDMTKLNTLGRIFVPMSHIAFIRVEVSNMTPMPNMIDTGEKDDNGKAIMEYRDGKDFKVLPS